MPAFRIYIVSTITVVALTGCQSYSQVSPDSWMVKPKVGSKLTLHQDLEVPLGKSRVYIQLGEVRKHADINEYKPYCYFYLNRPRNELENSMTIVADDFTIQNVYRRRVSFRYEKLQVATVFGMFEAGNSQRTMATYSDIYSPNQLQVTRLICAVWDDPYEYNHVSLAEIVRTLGNIATISS